MAQPPDSSDADGIDRGVAAAIAANFQGDAALHEAFATACILQFPTDIANGDAASAAGDLDQLGRLAHDLKTALILLGRGHASELAARAEACAQARDAVAAPVAWQVLKDALPRRDEGYVCAVDIN